MKLSDEHYTPKYIFDQLGLVFDLDVAAPVGNIGSHVPAKRFYSELDNGLEREWVGNIWMNPPFSKPTPWVERFIEHGQGIALLVVSRSKWFSKIWDIADAIVPTPYNMKFDRPVEKAKNISFQTFLFAIGEQNAQALHRVADRRVR